jgi:hypothetical protein
MAKEADFKTRTVAIITLSAGLVASLSRAETATDIDCVQCVDGREIEYQTIGSSRIRQGAVQTSNVAEGAITKKKIALDAVDSPRIMKGAVQTMNLAEGAVTKKKIAPDAVAGEAIRAGAVDWKKLAQSLQQRILDLEARVAQLEANSVMALDGYLELDTSDSSRPTVRFAGVNLQVINGAGPDSLEPNGLGNVIVGYDLPYTPRDADDFVCASGYFQDRESCEAEGFLWAQQHKSGSHNVIIGPEHRYSWMNALAVGRNNTINNFGASVVGGQGGYAMGQYSIVLGGGGNRATATSSAVLGGWNNWATNRAAHVSGGVHNRAEGQASTVSGGTTNTASGDGSTVGGGHDNTASGEFSTINGGYLNTAEGQYSTLGGGQERNVSGQSDWAAGSLWEDQ